MYVYHPVYLGDNPAFVHTDNNKTPLLAPALGQDSCPPHRQRDLLHTAACRPVCW